jgi:hypothetical protein
MSVLRHKEDQRNHQRKEGRQADDIGPSLVRHFRVPIAQDYSGNAWGFNADQLQLRA